MERYIDKMKELVKSIEAETEKLTSEAELDLAPSDSQLKKMEKVAKKFKVEIDDDGIVTGEFDELMKFGKALGLPEDAIEDEIVEDGDTHKFEALKKLEECDDKKKVEDNDEEDDGDEDVKDVEESTTDKFIKSLIEEGHIDEGTKEEYTKFFNAKLEKFGVKSPSELDDEKKKEFFNEIKTEWENDPSNSDA